MKKYIVAVIMLLVFTGISNAQISTAKAAYIYTITKYMKWPAEYNSGNFVIGVYKNDPIVSELKKLAARKKYENRKISIKVFNSVNEISKVHVLFVPSQSTSKLKEINSTLRRHNTVIIGDNPNAIRYGAGINFIVKNNRLNFEVKSINIIKKDIQVIKKVELMASRVY